ncbi:MAG TPA: archease [Candidatus Norongarragalinales archaeon]|nr:archease [Candidatus Norongarragalinales archaeon]
MEKYRFFDHTADILYEAYGSTFQEALENAALALFELIADTSKTEASVSVTIQQKGATLGELAIYVLSDLVAQRDARGLFFKEFKVTELKKLHHAFKLTGVARGFPMTQELGLMDVKAVTHHETEAFEKEGVWTVRVLLDI